ncbi:hypothetical protein BCR32DRAFT_292409 [Anaeromyces robustus]|uniref:Uncharacterized protein n=1 Tax=Anaeromyces robustus TaxID=1754192 RepID=A0A1Y1XBF7_9FUNG|nr:hypothetical protein BCR32DRAFT_292409 [Anaeromyces robustus]|eukprot:ORX82766.1 hypothetical protein BCR32DRAFT_292409 [Anaeromyces robustus]
MKIDSVLKYLTILDEIDKVILKYLTILLYGINDIIIQHNETEMRFKLIIIYTTLSIILTNATLGFSDVNLSSDIKVGISIHIISKGLLFFSSSLKKRVNYQYRNIISPI